SIRSAYSFGHRLAKSRACSSWITTTWPGSTWIFVIRSSGTSRLDMQSTQASIFRPYHVGKPNASAKTERNEPEAVILLGSMDTTTFLKRRLTACGSAASAAERSESAAAAG